MGTDAMEGKLYLGREYDQDSGAVTDQPVLYDPRHLTTHAVILGMTGSGKTGLGVVILEEALLQRLPVLIIDPKGDITNLLLTFPDLQGEDFAPWVNPEDARRRNLTMEAYAEEEAKKWREGLASWDITGERIAQLREAAQLTIFTPGSQAGQPVDVLDFFDTPQANWDDQEEALRERISGMVSGLLGLVGVEADPLQSPQHIILARIIEHVWRAGESLNLAKLIQLLQNPPFRQVGVFEVETFLPQKDRFELARSLNNLMAAPGFEVWQEGTPLNLNSLLYAADGRPQASIFYLAHLNDSQRSFFITLLLEAVRDWLRVQTGTTNLRALVYFDEVFGFFPPVANPPTKTPLMALVKQGRAAGLGVILATQNPADLDYKGLTNAGTWLIGALRAERDKERVLEGLEGAAAESGSSMDRQTLGRALGALKPRVFLMHNIRDDRFMFVHSRWAMSYLRGPLTRTQVDTLMDEVRTSIGTGEPAKSAAAPAPAVAQVVAAVAPQASAAPVADGLHAALPTLPVEITQVFLSPTVTMESALQQAGQQAGRSLSASRHQIVYVPHLLSLGYVTLIERKAGIEQVETTARLVPPDKLSGLIPWAECDALVQERDLSPQPAGPGLFEAVPAPLARAADIKRLEKDFADYLYHEISATVWHCPALGLYGKAGESRRDFRVRCEAAVRSQREAETKKQRDAFEKQKARLDERLRREKRRLAEEEADLQGRRSEEILSLGESALSLLTGRRRSTMLSSASRKRRMTKQAKLDVEQATDTIADLEAQIAAMETEWEEQQAEINARLADALEEIQAVQAKPRRTDVRVVFCSLAWVPMWQVSLTDGQSLRLPAREAPQRPPVADS
ncbi:MAG: DUF87 domain-containing protein [Anaerolineales bacterium]|nr:DUF87 domain-containing protein [Anaerolineales bacterium]